MSFEIPENYTEYLTDLRTPIKDNRDKLQERNKKRNNNLKEKVTYLSAKAIIMMAEEETSR